MTTRSQQTNPGRWLLLFLAALVGVLAVIGLAGTASANERGVSQNRVGAFNVAGQVLVEPPQRETAGQHLGPAEDSTETTLATGVAAKTGDDSVSLFKASQRGLGESHYANGYKPGDFPGNGAYFAREKEIADSYATHYGEGVIETRVPRGTYDEHFAQFEMKYLGSPPGTELAVPPNMLDFLSQFERIWHR